MHLTFWFCLAFVAALPASPGRHYRLPGRAPVPIKFKSYKVHAAAVQTKEPFPQWLTDITGYTEWPGENPPYIPMDFLDFSNLPQVPLRQKTDGCANVLEEHCAYECGGCTETGDVTTCSKQFLLQTFDDGPSPATDELLDNLVTKTTFFTLGKNVVVHPNTFRRQHREGHLLASHTWSHAFLPGLTDEEIAAQVQWSLWAMNATADVVPRYFRPPYGATDMRVRAITRQFGLINVFWNKDTFDWRLNLQTKKHSQVLGDAVRWQKQKGILLEHDSSFATVRAGAAISRILDKQMTVADCVDGEWYQRTAPFGGSHH